MLAASRNWPQASMPDSRQRPMFGLSPPPPNPVAVAFNLASASAPDRPVTVRILEIGVEILEY